ncbi:MAG: 7-cyano-7-deazaguanine synthase [Tepidisphaeraceae bacterium]
MAKDLAIVLNNGSMNSAVATAIAAQKYRTVMVFAEVEQGPGSRARASYDQQVAHFKPYREHTIAMPFLAAIASPRDSASVVTDPRQPAPLGPQMLELLPLFAAAVRYAVHYHAAAIYTGLRIGGEGDELAQATEYVQIWNELIQLPCGQSDLSIESPLLELEPWQVVDVGFQVAAPFERTWSCMEETSEPCWACRGCRAREASFQQSGKADPMRAVKRL